MERLHLLPRCCRSIFGGKFCVHCSSISIFFSEKMLFCVVAVSCSAVASAVALADETGICHIIPTRRAIILFMRKCLLDGGTNFSLRNQNWIV